MTDYTIILDTSLDPDAPLTSNLAYAWRDNPIAIAEGAVDAPKIAVKTLGGSSASGTLSFTGIGAFSGVLAHGAVFTDGSNRILTVALSDDGTTYATASALLDDGGLAGPYTFSIFIDFATGAFKCTHNSIDASLPLYSSGTLAGAGASVSAIRFTVGGTSTMSALVMPNGGESAS